ncbi:STAS domain-containing protein [Streptomyces sp. CRN 30]|uniref:STAS domain-containing protein n=1 Tax=Streptomyces sp. CRN 30 TaxID=3075613 RepID=UPI002A814425|nr:STAS domain-containing protein [Streptomyces sp. CRN 30]
MTQHTTTELSLTIIGEPTALTVRVAGELDHETCEELVETVTACLGRSARLRDVRLDFHDLEWIDSSGLAALLMVHRRTSAAGATLHLDDRPRVLERMLQITNVLDHLTAPAASAEARSDGMSGAGTS